MARRQKTENFFNFNHNCESVDKTESLPRVLLVQTQEFNKMGRRDGVVLSAGSQNLPVFKTPLGSWECLFSKRTYMHIPVWHSPDLELSLEDWKSHVLNHNGLWPRVYREFSPSNVPKSEYINTYFKRTCFSIGSVTIRGSCLNRTWMKRRWLQLTVFP